MTQCRSGIMRHFKSDWSSTADYTDYNTTELTDGNISNDAALVVEDFSSHKDDFWAIFEANKTWIISKVRVYLPNDNSGENDNGKPGFVNNEISIAIGDDLGSMGRVKTFSNLEEVSELEYILPEAKKVKYVAIICNLNPYFYPSLAEVEAYGIDEGARVDNVTADSDKTVTGYYNLQGIEIKDPTTGFYIVRYSNGTTRKIIMK